MHDNIHAQSEQRDRPRNEDRSWAGKISLSDKTAAWAVMVADGVGGHRFGAEVAEMAIDALRKAIEGGTAKDFAGEEAIRAWLDTWAPKLQEGVRTTYPLGFSTLCAAIQIGKDVVLLSVGDSPVFQMDAGMGVRRVFEPHTRGQARIKNGESEDDIESRDFSVLIRAVGLQQDGTGPLLDFRLVRVTEPTWFLLGSDGVFNYLEGIELFKTISAMKRPGASEIAAVLLTRSLDNGRRTGKHLDNATIAVLGVMQKTRRKRRTAVMQSHGSTGGGARRIWISILLFLLVVLVGVLAAGFFFFRDAFPSAPTVADGAAAAHTNRVASVARDSGDSGEGDEVPGKTVLPPPTADDSAETQPLPPAGESLPGGTAGAVPLEAVPPTRVVLRVQGAESNVAADIIWCAYSDHSTMHVRRTGDWYDIPDAQNVLAIELGESGTMYDVARDGNGADGIAMWRLIPRNQGSSGRGNPPGELSGARGAKPGPKPHPPFSKGNAEAARPSAEDKPAPERRTGDDRDAATPPDAEPANGGNGRIPESDFPSATRKGTAQNFIALQLPNENQEYHGKARIELSSGNPIDIPDNRTYGQFRIGSHTVGEIVAIVVGYTTYTNKGQWRFTNMQQGQQSEYVLISLDDGPDSAPSAGMSSGAQAPPVETPSEPLPPPGMAGTDKTGRAWP